MASKPILFLRSALLALCMLFFTPFWACICMLAAPLPYPKRYFVISRWNAVVIWLAKAICGIRYEVKGRENLPDAPAILLCKHQSAWETIFLLYQMPRPVVFVLKKELLNIPFFGWALRLMHSIPIDRKQGVRAFRQVITEGRKRLEDDHWIVMFPEGTRTPVGEQGEYKGGGTRLAISTKTLVVPIALNSGECWPRNAFIKRPGLITVSIGHPISPEGQTHESMMQHVENWIESEMRIISPGAYLRK